MQPRVMVRERRVGPPRAEPAVVLLMVKNVRDVPGYDRFERPVVEQKRQGHYAVQPVWDGLPSHPVVSADPLAVTYLGPELMQVP